MEKILFINACVRPFSRTLELAKHVLSKLSGDIEEVKLYNEQLLPLDLEEMELRDKSAISRDFTHCSFNCAKQFANADEIIIAAPFWDLSFPAKLKIYLEQITVSGITFKYLNGHPSGLCKAKKLTYITTSGGPIFDDFGYAYVKTLAQKFYGIEKTEAVRAMNLDVDLISAEELLEKSTISVVE